MVKVANISLVCSLVFLYGVEAWTLKKNQLEKLQAFKIWRNRRMWHISGTDTITNKELLTKMNKECEIVNTIKKEKAGALRSGDEGI